MKHFKSSHHVLDTPLVPEVTVSSFLLGIEVCTSKEGIMKSLLFHVKFSISKLVYTANVFAVKVTGFPCVTLEPCKVHVTITGKLLLLISLQIFN